MREDIEILLSFSNMVDRITNAEAIRQYKEQIITDFWNHIMQICMRWKSYILVINLKMQIWII